MSNIFVLFQLNSENFFLISSFQFIINMLYTYFMFTPSLIQELVASGLESISHPYSEVLEASETGSTKNIFFSVKFFFTFNVV